MSFVTAHHIWPIKHWRDRGAMHKPSQKLEPLLDLVSRRRMRESSIQRHMQQPTTSDLGLIARRQVYNAQTPIASHPRTFGCRASGHERDGPPPGRTPLFKIDVYGGSAEASHACMGWYGDTHALPPETYPNVAHAQCGGERFTGARCCRSNAQCCFRAPEYSECWPRDDPFPPDACKRDL
jgi:hypothetical protein